MKQVPISVIIPTYQHAGTIELSLRSIFSQTVKPLEIIVVNDGSTDNTKQILEPFLDKITLINQENQGSNKTRNNGFAHSSGAYVLFCDADILMRPDMLEKMMDALNRHPEAHYVYSGFRWGWKKFRSFPFNAERLRKMNYIHTTSLIRREEFPGFDPTIRRFQDWDLWLTMLQGGRLGVFIDDELFRVLAEGRLGIAISRWLPSFIYKVPWGFMGWTPKAVHAYEDARAFILEKHNLTIPEEEKFPGDASESV